MIFWMTIMLSLICTLKTGKTRQINKWDILFFLSSWQTFNLGVWQEYIKTTQAADPYQISAVICILITALYICRRGILIKFELSNSAIKSWLAWAVILSLVLITIGFKIGFLKWNPRLDPKFLRATALDYFIFVAAIEELVFRGLIFNLLKRSLDEYLSLFLTTALFACIFSHIAGGGIFPNWPYVGMAFVAGGAYGLSYQKTGNLLVPILLHGTVDSVWRIFFS